MVPRQQIKHNIDLDNSIAADLRLRAVRNCVRSVTAEAAVRRAPVDDSCAAAVRVVAVRTRHHGRVAAQRGAGVVDRRTATRRRITVQLRQYRFVAAELRPQFVDRVGVQ